MYFESFSDAVAMAGHGPYVWTAYAITAAIIVSLVVTPIRRQAAVRKQLRNEWRRDRARQGE